MSLRQMLRLRPVARVCDHQAQRFAASLHRKLTRKDFVAAESELAGASDQNRERLLYGFASTEGSVPLAAQWASGAPNSAFANVQLGACLIVAGWKIRGSSYAEDVDEAAWQPFLRRLSSAEEPLHLAARLDPKLAEPYAWLIHAGLGRGAEQEELRMLFMEASRREPLHWGAHYKYFMAVTEKWGGSHEAMFAFVRERARAAPRGSLLHMLVAAAYLELALALTSRQSARKAAESLRRRQYADEVAHALYSWLDATPATLQSRLERTGGGFGRHALNQFGAAAYLCGAQSEARALLSALGGEIETVPWTWLCTGLRERLLPALVYERACLELGVALE